MSLCLVAALPCVAQKALKPAAEALKQKKYKETITQVEKLRADSLLRDNVKLCLYSIEANRALNDAENTKIYLKQACDTAALFSTTRQILREAQRIDSIETVLQAEQGKKPKQERLTIELAKRYFPNILAASRFYYYKKNYTEAMNYLDMALQLPISPLGQKASLSSANDTTYAAMYVMSACESKQYAAVHRYDSLALTMNAARPAVLKALIHTAQAENDDAAYCDRLSQGWQEYPHDAQFFTQLADYYNTKRQYDETLRLAARQLQVDSLSAMAHYARCVACYELQRYDSCAASAADVMRLDSANAQAYYYSGASHVAQAEAFVMPSKPASRAYKEAFEKRQQIYRLAETDLETYRTRCPEEQKLWAPLLYKVYLALNRGKKFAEIEALVNL